ncbi:MAG: DUF222 domain-containing protein [Acidimicrobiia bacterium]|nr:DUF222 domain-containing protein [Acidimicrobiia bacterium]
MANRAVTRDFEATLKLPAADPEDMSGDQRRASLASVRRVEARLAGWKTRLIGAERDQHGVGAAEMAVREELRASKREAKRDVETATSLSGLTETWRALEAGEIPQKHAWLIAKASSEGPIDETALTEAARHQPYDQFARTLRQQQRELAEDDGQSILDRQCEKRRANMFESREDGMFVVSGEFDPIIGNRIALAISDKERELWRKEDPKSRRTPQQRMADALAELILEPKSGQPPRTALLVIADYDAVHQELVNARLCDGTPIPLGEMRRLACDADILPAVFRAKTQRLWLGRKRRIATEAQRVALALRDKGCVGCDANPAWCQAHHIQPWSWGGPTNLDNLVLVCARCHHNIHNDGWEVVKCPTTRRYDLRPPSEPFPDEGTISYRSSQRNSVLLS